jgi:DNA-binding winged helix-turn-helix (wHTH) protein/tetratricopeptide (TPR) repeat protein
MAAARGGGADVGGTAAARSFRFASFTLDLDRLCLNTPSGEVKLRPKSFEVLRYLVAHAQRVVTKDEVIETVWPDVTVTEESLTRCISEVRRALGVEGHRIIRTVPKRGYVLDVPTVAGEVRPAPRPPVAVAVGREPRTPPTTHPAAGERRQTTVMACSVKGLAALAARLDPEDLRDAIAACYAGIAAVVEHHGGHVGKHLADGIVATFGYPLAHEDDAERAVRAGLAATRAVAGLAIAGLDAPLAARVGIATGVVVVDDATAGAPSAEPALFGETPLLAERLAGLAPAGSVVMSGATRHVVGRLFECREIGAGVHGGPGLAGASVVLGEGGIASRYEALRGSEGSPLVGRGEELDALVRRWEQAKRGSGRVVLLTGEAGIGKSRTARALQDRLAGEPYAALVYHCSPHHRDTALYPIVTQLLRTAGIRGSDSPQTKLEKLEATLAATGAWPAEQVALLAALLSIPGGERYPAPDLTPQHFKERVLDALMEGIRRLCARGPVLAVFEDLHWIDPTSLEQLSNAVEAIPGLPLLLVATARPEFVPPWPNHWHTAVMPLTRLAPADVETLIGGVAQGKALPLEVAAEIVARTDGVPLFVEELTKTLLESGLLQDAGDRWELDGPLPLRAIPSTLHASLLERLDRLASVKDLAQIAAAIGPDFSHGLLAAVADVAGQELGAGLAQLVAAGLVTQRGTPPDATYRFKHTLVRDAVYASLVRGRRRHLHGAIAGVLEERFPDIVAAAPETLAHQWAEAGMPDKAASYWAKAGRLSLSRSAMAEASTQLERAMALLEGLPGTAEVRRAQIDLRLMLFQPYLTRGEIARMTATLMAAADTARALGDERRLALATAQLAMAQWMQGDHVAAAEAASFVLERAERTDDLPLQIFSKYTLANALHGQGRLDAAIGLHREVIETLTRRGLEGQRLAWAGLPSVMARAFLAWFLIEAGAFDEARRQIEEGCALADAAQQPYSQVLIHAAEGLWHLRRGCPERAVPILERTLPMCQRVSTMEAMLAGWLGTALVGVGRAAEALAITEAAFQRGAHLAGGMYTWFYLFKAIGEAQAALGSGAEALAWVDKAIEVTRDAQECLHYAQGLQCRGDVRLHLCVSMEAAIGDLEAARQIGEHHGLLPLVSACDLSLARALRHLGRNEAARRHASRAARGFRSLGLERPLAEAEGLAG